MRKTLYVILLFLGFFVLSRFALNVSQKFGCDLESLLLKDNMLPAKWEKLWQVLPPALPTNGAIDALEVDYEYGNDMAAHTIYRYKNVLVAYLFLKINRQVYFPTSGWKWSNLAGSEDWELNGDEFRIRCGDSNDPFLDYLCVSGDTLWFVDIRIFVTNRRGEHEPGGVQGSRHCLR